MTEGRQPGGRGRELKDDLWSLIVKWDLAGSYQSWNDLLISMFSFVTNHSHLFVNSLLPLATTGTRSSVLGAKDHTTDEPGDMENNKLKIQHDNGCGCKLYWSMTFSISKPVKHAHIFCFLVNFHSSLLSSSCSLVPRPHPAFHHYCKFSLSLLSSLSSWTCHISFRRSKMYISLTTVHFLHRPYWSNKDDRRATREERGGN